MGKSCLLSKNKDEVAFYKGRRGSFTIEAMVIVPVVFFCVIFSIFAALRLYRTVTLQLAVNLAAQRGASTWDDLNRDIDTGKIMNTRKDQKEANETKKQYELYWRIYDIWKEEKEQRIVNWLLSRTSACFSSKFLTKWNDGDDANEMTANAREIIARVKTKDYIFFKKLLLEARQNTKEDVIYAEAIAVEPAEFIRSIDLMKEIIDDAVNYLQGISNFIDKIKELAGHIKN